MVVPMLAALALAVQSEPALLRDPAFLTAHRAWAACTDRVVDAGASSQQTGEALADAALAACPAEQEAVHRAVIAASGEEQGREDMAALLTGNREALIDRVRKVRARRAAASTPDVLITIWVACLSARSGAASSDVPEDQAVDGAFSACAGDEDALRRAARARGGAGRANEFIREARAANREILIRELRERRAQRP